MKEDRLVVFLADIIDIIHEAVTWMEILPGRMKLQSFEIQNGKGVFEFFGRLFIMGIDAGETNETIRRHIDELLYLFIGDEDFAIHPRAVIFRKQYRIVDLRAVHLVEEMFQRCRSVFMQIEFIVSELFLLFIFVDRLEEGRMDVDIDDH